MTGLIAESISTSVLPTARGIQGTAKSSLHGDRSPHVFEPEYVAAEIDIREAKLNNTLETLTARLSLDNVATAQDVTLLKLINTNHPEQKERNEQDKALSTPLGANDITESRYSAKRLIQPDEHHLKEDRKSAVSKATAESSKLRENKAEKGLDGLTEDERRQVEELKRRDAEVRAHEQAHAAAGGPYSGAPRFRFVRGPDGKFYAAGGEVSLDTSTIPGNPEATIRKMQQIKRAALAPQEPSAQDRRVAADAERKILQARQEIRERENEEVKKSQNKQKTMEEEAQGFERSVIPKQRPVFDPSARFRLDTGGTGPAPGTGLAGTGGLDVDSSDVIDPKQLFSMVA